MKWGNGSTGVSLLFIVELLAIAAWISGYLLNRLALEACQPVPLAYGQAFIELGLFVFGAKIFLENLMEPSLRGRLFGLLFILALWAMGVYQNQMDLDCVYSGSTFSHLIGQVLMTFGLSVETVREVSRLWARGRQAAIPKESKDQPKGKPPSGGGPA